MLVKVANIATGRVNIRIHRDITGEMWFGVGETLTLKVVQRTGAGHLHLTDMKKVVISCENDVAFLTEGNKLSELQVHFQPYCRTYR